MSGPTMKRTPWELAGGCEGRPVQFETAFQIATPLHTPIDNGYVMQARPLALSYPTAIGCRRALESSAIEAVHLWVMVDFEFGGAVQPTPPSGGTGRRPAR